MITRGVNFLSSKFNLVLKISKRTEVSKAFEPKFSPRPPCIFLNCSNNFIQKSILKNEHDSQDFYAYPVDKFCYMVQKIDLPVLKKITDPEKIVNIKIEVPLNKSVNNEMDLPCNIEKDMVEPVKNITAKKAVNMLRVRRKKMRKHKYLKFIKKMRFEFAKKKSKKELEKELVFQTGLKKILKAGENFSAEQYINDVLKKVHYIKPVTKVRKRLAPQWVIKDHLKYKEEKKILHKRLDKCINSRK